MMKILAPLLVILGLFAAVIAWFAGVNNSLVAKQETVNESWAQVENVYQRRADLIPNLVNTVKGYAKHESSVLEEVTRARASVGQVKVQNGSDLQKFDQAQSQLTGALQRLLVVAENYPNLKADQSFRDLQSQLEGTENRISVERRRFNETARDYNTYLRQFPQSFVAGFRNFKERPYFQSKAGSDQAPQVNF